MAVHVETYIDSGYTFQGHTENRWKILLLSGQYKVTVTRDANIGFLPNWCLVVENQFSVLLAVIEI